MKFFQVLKSKVSALQVAFAAMFAMFSLGAHAALPTWASSMTTDVGAAIEDTAAAVGPLVIASLVAIIIIKLIKRFANKI